MKSPFHGSLALCLLATASLAGAATQGSLSSTSSSGTIGVTANRPVLQRQVQILGISDVTISSTTSSELAILSGQGSTTAFCIVDTYGEALSMQVSPSAGGRAFGNWGLIDGSGNVVRYRVTFTNASRSTTYGASGPGYPLTVSLPAGLAVTASGSCGSGNMKAHFDMVSALPQTYPARASTDALTLTITPQ